MPEVLVAIAGNQSGTASLSLTIDGSGKVTEATFTNTSGSPARVLLTGPAGEELARVIGQSTVSRSLPKPRQFAYESSDWQAQIELGG